MTRSLVVCLTIATLLVLGSTAHALLWEGVDWSTYNSAPLSINLDGDLVVGSDDAYAAAHYNTPTSFRSALTPWIELSFIDEGPGTQRAQMWVEKEGIPGAAWFQFGSWNASAYPTFEQYGLYWWNVDTDTDGWQWLGDRTAGEHTMKVGMRSDGTVDYWFDGGIAWSTTDIVPTYFGDVYLASRYGSTIFTNYQAGTDYSYESPLSAVPEPGSIVLLAIASIGIAGAIRRKKKT